MRKSAHKYEIQTTVGDLGAEGEGDAPMLLLNVAVTSKRNYVIQHSIEDQNLGGFTDNEAAITQYLFYDINDAFSAGGRFEWIEQMDSDFQSGQFQTTLGVNVRPTDNVVIRPEVRFHPERSDQTVFGVDAIPVF